MCPDNPSSFIRRNLNSEVIASRSTLSNLSKEDLIDIILLQNDIQIPVGIFSTDLAPLESLVKYLKEIRRLSFKEISARLNRNFKTIWTTYSHSKDKKLVSQESSYFVPLMIFSKQQLRGLSVLESLVTYLKEYYSLSLTQISGLINRDIRTIWTCYQRGNSKLSKSGITLKKSGLDGGRTA